MSLFSTLSVSASGMSAQRTRAELLVENLANSETTRTPEGGPYKSKDVVFTSEPQGSPFGAVFQTEMSAGVNGVAVSEIIEDPPAGGQTLYSGASRRRQGWLRDVSASGPIRGHGEFAGRLARVRSQHRGD